MMARKAELNQTCALRISCDPRQGTEVRISVLLDDTTQFWGERFANQKKKNFFTCHFKGFVLLDYYNYILLSIQPLTC